ncbi:MAG: leucine-rich repeat protein [Firmicutes bacterium]|nr:leucine-rich repeat protein [Bacillota bacterium]
MTAIIESRPRIPRLAMVFIAAVVVMLLTAPKAGAWSGTTGDFKIEKPYSSYGSTKVTVKEYTGNDTDITLPSTVTYSGTEYKVTAVGSNVLKKLAGTEEIDLTVTIPEGYTTIEGNAFQNCYGLKSITIPGSVTEINYNAFDGCKDLAAVTFADGEKALSFGNKVFYNCTALNDLALPTRTSSIGAGIFQGCTGLTTLSTSSDAYFAQDGVLYQKNSDGNGYTLHSWASGSSATDFTIPSEVNGKPVTSIFRMAFQNNTTLQSVTIPASVTDFQTYCFENCAALKKISVAAENVTLSNSCFTGLPEGSVIEVANDTVKDAFEPSRTSYGSTETHYTAGNTTVQVKGASAPQTSSAELTAKGTGVKDGYAYYKLTLDNAENIKTMLLHLSFDAAKVSKNAQVEGKKDAYVKLNDKRFSLVTVNWTEADGKIDAKILLIPKDNGEAISGTDAANLLLVGLPVKNGVTGNIAMTVTAAQCAGINTEDDSLMTGTVTVNGSPASNRVTSYDVYADGTIDILDITEAQRFYQVSSSDDDWAAAQKADVNADDKVDIQDLIDIFLQIEF